MIIKKQSFLQRFSSHAGLNYLPTPLPTKFKVISSTQPSDDF